MHRQVVLVVQSDHQMHRQVVARLLINFFFLLKLRSWLFYLCDLHVHSMPCPHMTTHYNMLHLAVFDTYKMYVHIHVQVMTQSYVCTQTLFPHTIIDIHM